MEKHGTKENADRLTELEDLLAQKTTIVEKLIADKDKIIEQELRRYDDAAFYIHLQSHCFKLYPLIVHVLLAMIDSSLHRSIFCTIIKGRNIERFAKRISFTPEQVGKTFCEIVDKLHRKTKDAVKMIEQNEASLRRYRELVVWSETAAEEKERRQQSMENTIATLQKKIATLKRDYSKKKKEHDRLSRQLEREMEVRNELMKENARLQGEVQELTVTGKSFFKRLLWLMGC